MKVIIKIEVSDEARRALRFALSRSGKATRREVVNCIVGDWEDDLRGMLDHYRNDPDRRKREARKLNNLGPGLGMKPRIEADKHADFIRHHPELQSKPGRA